MFDEEKPKDEAKQKIIVNHETPAEDPQGEQSDNDESAEIILPQTTKELGDESSANKTGVTDRIVIEPDKTPDEVDSKELDEDEVQPKEVKNSEAVDDKTDDHREKSATHEGSDNIVNELAEAAASKKQEKTDNDHEQAYIQSLEKLVEEKTYNVPIGQLTHKRNTRIIVAVFIVIAVLVAVTIMSFVS